MQRNNTFKLMIISVISVINLVIMKVISNSVIGVSMDRLDLLLSYILATVIGICLVIPIFGFNVAKTVKTIKLSSFLILFIYTLLFTVMMITYALQDEGSRKIGFLKYYMFAVVTHFVMQTIDFVYDTKTVLNKTITGYAVCVVVSIPFLINEEILKILSTWVMPLFILTMANFTYISFATYIAMKKSKLG